MILLSSIVNWASALSQSATSNATCKRRSSRHRSEEHKSELQSPDQLVCRLLLEKKKNNAWRSRIFQQDMAARIHGFTVLPRIRHPLLVKIIRQGDLRHRLAIDRQLFVQICNGIAGHADNALDV